MDAMNIRMEKSEEGISDITDKIKEINEAEQKRQRRIMQHENTIKELSDSIKCITFILYGSQKNKEKRGQKVYLRKS